MCISRSSYLCHLSESKVLQLSIPGYMAHDIYCTVLKNVLKNHTALNQMCDNTYLYSKPCSPCFKSHVLVNSMSQLAVDHCTNFLEACNPLQNSKPFQGSHHNTAVIKCTFFMMLHEQLRVLLISFDSY